MRLTLAIVSLAALACLAPSTGRARSPSACAGPYRLEVVDEAGRPLPTFAHRGRSYVLGTLGQRYVLRVRNDGARRVEVVASVDGRDVVDGGPAAWEKRGYLVDPGGEITIDGFRISTDAVAAFRFSSVPRSYAALSGDSRDVGVIGVAVFPERDRPQDLLRRRVAPQAAPESRGDARPAAPRAEAGVAQRRSSDAASERPGLGTEFAEEHDSHVRLVSFERSSSRPDTLLSVRYDDRDGLLALGIDVDGRRWASGSDARLRETAEPFRQNGFARPPPGWRGER